MLWPTDRMCLPLPKMRGRQQRAPRPRHTTPPTSRSTCNHSRLRRRRRRNGVQKKVSVREGEERESITRACSCIQSWALDMSKPTALMARKLQDRQLLCNAKRRRHRRLASQVEGEIDHLLLCRQLAFLFVLIRTGDVSTAQTMTQSQLVLGMGGLPVNRRYSRQ